MSSSSSSSPGQAGLSTFADIAAAYRIYVLDDLLAEPQELALDRRRGLLYASRRHVQGHAYTPIEPARDIAVLDLNSFDVVVAAAGGSMVDVGGGSMGGMGSMGMGMGMGMGSGMIDVAPYSGPHCLELVDRPDGQGPGDACDYLLACVDGGAGVVWIDPDARAVAAFEPGADAASDCAPQQSQHHHHHHQQSGRGAGSGSGSGSSRRARRSQRSSSGSASGGEGFVAEIDLRTGKMRRRVNVSLDDDYSRTDGRHVAFSAPTIRFASRSSSSGMPVVDVVNDPILEVIKARFGVMTLFVTSRSAMLV
ncbi:hypothetical protein GGR56DRAFT_675320 [Xylariaceae sp. FL0804]|nr:hypothetical protein GGR56DRAFT_675320 [Xylariaceae sp. FL0804]